MDPERYPESLAFLWMVKSSIIGLAFPFFVAMLVPIRMALGRWMDREHIALLDADETPSDEEFREVGV